MVSIINTLIICATVLYCIRMIVQCVNTKSNVSSESAEPITDKDVDEAYEDLRKENKIPSDLTEFMQAMQLDLFDK